MRRTMMINVVLVGTLILAVSAGAQGLMGVIQHAEHGGPDAIAAAVLSPVGAVDGWGRIVVMDETTSAGVERQANVMVFGLDPETAYTAVVNGVELASFATDASGTAMVRLEDGDDEHDPVPADLPPAEELLTAMVLDDSGAAVLEGSFIVVTPGSDPANPVYRETIPLLDVTGGLAQGMAQVERGADDSQEFSTRAAGLEPGTQYQIVVDGILAGVVTAGSLGYAELELRAPDDENPLPETLQPVEDLRLVEWQLLDGSTVLSGSFSGTPDGGQDGDGPGDGGHDGEGGGFHSIHGMIAAFVDGGFLLQTGMAVITVEVTDQTVFDGFSSLDELEVGSMVEVEGELQGDVLVAERIELMDGGGPGDGDHDGDGGGQGGGDHDGDGGVQASVPGMITAFVDGGFLLQAGPAVITVEVTEGTVFDGFSSLDELEVGSMVEVEGELQGDVLVAERIELMDGSGGGGMF